MGFGAAAAAGVAVRVALVRFVCAPRARRRGSLLLVDPEITFFCWLGLTVSLCRVLTGRRAATRTVSDKLKRLEASHLA